MSALAINRLQGGSFLCPQNNQAKETSAEGTFHWQLLSDTNFAIDQSAYKF